MCLYVDYRYREKCPHSVRAGNRRVFSRIVVRDKIAIGLLIGNLRFTPRYPTLAADENSCDEASHRRISRLGIYCRISRGRRGIPKIVITHFPPSLPPSLSHTSLSLSLYVCIECSRRSLDTKIRGSRRKRNIDSRSETRLDRIYTIKFIYSRQCTIMFEQQKVLHKFLNLHVCSRL